jgi:hypothetical protein
VASKPVGKITAAHAVITFEVANDRLARGSPPQPLSDLIVAHAPLLADVQTMFGGHCGRDRRLPRVPSCHTANQSSLGSIAGKSRLTLKQRAPVNINTCPIKIAHSGHCELFLGNARPAGPRTPTPRSAKPLRLPP